jgi:hypothetical protein
MGVCKSQKANQSIFMVGISQMGLRIGDNKQFVPAHSKRAAHHQEPLIHQQTEYDHSHTNNFPTARPILTDHKF